MKAPFSPTFTLFFFFAATLATRCFPLIGYRTTTDMSNRKGVFSNGKLAMPRGGGNPIGCILAEFSPHRRSILPG